MDLALEINRRREIYSLLQLSSFYIVKTKMEKRFISLTSPFGSSVYEYSFSKI